MEYFILQRSKKMLNPLTVSANDKNFHVDDGAVRILTKLKDDTSVPDYFFVNKMFQYYYFISEELYEIWKDYTDFLQEEVAVVCDPDAPKAYPFLWVNVELVDCVVPNRGIMQNSIKIREESVRDKFIFRIQDDRGEYIAVSLHVAEHMLRSNAYGVEYIPVETVREREL